MKRVHIHAKDNAEIKISNLSDLPSKIGLVTTIQHLHKLDDVKKFLEGEGKKVTICGQVLGCNAKCAIGADVDAYLYIGSGKFHPIAIQLETLKDVYVLKGDKAEKLDNKEIEIYKKREKAGLVRFYSAKNVGVLISTKQGQNRTDDAVKLKKELKDKNVYLFIFETLDFSQLENFPFIDVWVNTACPRIMDDWEKLRKPVINIDVLNYSLSQK